MNQYKQLIYALISFFLVFPISLFLINYFKLDDSKIITIIPLMILVLTSYFSYKTVKIDKLKLAGSILLTTSLFFLVLLFGFTFNSPF